MHMGPLTFPGKGKREINISLQRGAGVTGSRSVWEANRIFPAALAFESADSVMGLVLSILRTKKESKGLYMGRSTMVSEKNLGLVW